MRHITTICTLALCATMLTSCIRETYEPCPAMQVNIDIKDHNFFNVDKVVYETRRPENLAFYEYVPTLFYSLRRADTGELMEEQGPFYVEDEDQTINLKFCDCYPHGKYVLTVWGGLEDASAVTDDGNVADIDFHPHGQPALDIYMTNDTLNYTADHYSYTVKMQRAKGRLVIVGENLPDGYRATRQTISGISAHMNERFEYSGEKSIVSDESWMPGGEPITETWLAPSLVDDGTKVHAEFYNPDDPTATPLRPKDIVLTMDRNYYSVVRYVWQEKEKDFQIFVLVNDNWEEVHGMEVE